MTQAGLAVPPGFIITANSIATFLKVPALKTILAMLAKVKPDDALAGGRRSAN